MASLLEIGEYEHESEKQLCDFLRQSLPDDWVILSNLEIVQRGAGSYRSYEIDAIVIGNGYVWLVEVKCWNGVFQCDKSYWAPQKGSPRPSPITTLAGKSRKIAGELRKSCHKNSYVAHLIIMMGKKYELVDNGEPRLKNCVFTQKEAVNFFSSPPYKEKKIFLDSDDIQNIIKTLAGAVVAKRYKESISAKKPEKINTKSAKPKSTDNKFSDIEKLIIFTLSDNHNFSRVYYSDELRQVLLGRKELRGAKPSVWRDWTNQGVMLFLNPLSNNVSLKRNFLKKNEFMVNGQNPDNSIQLESGAGMMNIGGMSFNYKVEVIELT